MQTEIETVLGDLSIQEAVSIMRYSGTRSLLVVPRQQDEPYGIVSYSDVVYNVIAAGKDATAVTVDDIATSPAFAVRPDDNVQQIALHFHKHNIGHAPVVDHHSKLIGVVSMTDLITEAISEPRP
jgi:CBS domain-containing protein